MKLCQAAVVALVGWYLMVPTPLIKQDLTVQADLPLSKWTIVQSSDSAKDCQLALTAARREYARFITGPESNNKKLGVLFALGQCIATDDPRLKEK